MIKLLLASCLFLVFFKYSFSQSARLKGIGNSGVATRNNTIFSNQAGLAEIKDISLSIFSENKYLIQGWYQNNISTIIPIKSSIIGVGAIYDGINIYNNKALAVSYSNKLTDEIAFGMLLKHSENFIQDYGKNNYYDFEFGLLAKLAPAFNLGMHLSNPFSSINASDNRLQHTSIFRFGFSYQPDEIVWLTTEIDKQIYNTPNLKFGMEYQPTKPLFIRIGLNSFPFNVYSGLGIIYKSFRYDMAISYHSVLGYSPAISLSYSFGKDE